MKRRSSRSRSSTRKHATEGLAVTTTLLCAAGNLAAQNAAPAPTEPATGATLPTVVVEGSQDKVYKPERVESPKIQGPLRDVPQTITVIPEAVIKEQNATSLRDVLRNVPGIAIQAGEGGGGPAGDNLSIRGFSAKTDIFVDNVRDFFANFYVPSNASLVVAGDFESEEIKPLIDELFGSLHAGQLITREYVRPKEPLPRATIGVQRFTGIDRVEQPKVQYTYHSPVAFGPGDAEMQLAA